MKIIYTILVVVALLLLGNWYYTAYAPAPDKIDDTEVKNIEDTNIISTVDPKSDISFSYPKELGTSYISTQSWPPTFVNGDGIYNCDIDVNTAAMSGFASRSETFNGTDYCIWERGEGAAGSTYIDYQTTFYPKTNSAYITMNFTLRYVRCENYPEEEVGICQNEQDNFEVMTLIDEMAKSAKLPAINL